MSICCFEQIRMARAALGWSVQRLADESLVSSRTLNRIETSLGFTVATVANLKLIQQTFEAAGIEFVGDLGEGPGVRLWATVSASEN